jgi:hypothetical protein
MFLRGQNQLIININVTSANTLIQSKAFEYSKCLSVRTWHASVEQRAQSTNPSKFIFVERGAQTRIAMSMGSYATTLPLARKELHDLKFWHEQN